MQVTGTLLRNMPVREDSAEQGGIAATAVPFFPRAFPLQTFSKTESGSNRGLLRAAGMETPGAGCPRREGVKKREQRMLRKASTGRGFRKGDERLWKTGFPRALTAFS